MEQFGNRFLTRLLARPGGLAILGAVRLAAAVPALVPVLMVLDHEGASATPAALVGVALGLAVALLPPGRLGQPMVRYMGTELPPYQQRLYAQVSRLGKRWPMALASLPFFTALALRFLAADGSLDAVYSFSSIFAGLCAGFAMWTIAVGVQYLQVAAALSREHEHRA